MAGRGWSGPGVESTTQAWDRGGRGHTGLGPGWMGLHRSGPGGKVGRWGGGHMGLGLELRWSHR